MQKKFVESEMRIRKIAYIGQFFFAKSLLHLQKNCKIEKANFSFQILTAQLAICMTRVS
jgi:hypothetical protein